MSELSFLHTDSYNETDLQSAIQRHFELLNIQIAPDEIPKQLLAGLHLCNGLAILENLEHTDSSLVLLPAS